MAYKPTAPAEEPARGPKGSKGTDRFGSESAPTSAWNSTVPQRSAGEGDYPYPDAHSTVPTPDADKGDYFPWPAERSTVAPDGAGEGDYPVPEERSTVAPQSAGTGASGPRREWPRDSYAEEDAGINDGGGDGGDYRWGIPYTQDMPEHKEWGMFGPEYGGYGHAEEVKVVDYHAARKDDWGAVDGPPHDADWDNKATESRGYEVLGQERDEAPPSIPDSEQYQTANDGTYGDEYPQPDNITWDAEPQNLVLKK